MAHCSIVFERSVAQSSKPDITAQNNQPSWTAARCQRLLRPLSSKIALLRREKQRSTHTEEFRQANIGTNAKVYNTECDSQGSHRAEKTNAADEEWAPNPRPRKKIKRTYSSKSLNPQHRENLAQSDAAEPSTQNRGEIAIPIDFLQIKRPTQAEDCFGDNTADQRGITYESKPLAQMSGENGERLWQGSSRCAYKVRLPFQWRLVDGICRGVEALFKATESRKTISKGARGLFSTCLRQVPDYIIQAELRHKAEDPESDIDVSSIVYSDLESLSTSETAGWSPLRQVVRTHGIRMVGQAVREGLLSINVTRGIIAFCTHLRAYDEAEHLLECLFELIDPWPKPSMTLEKTRSILNILDAFVTATDIHSVRYRILIRLLGSGKVPLDWIARHDMIGTWNKVIQSITQRDDHAGPATELLRLVVTMYYGLPGNNPSTFIQTVRLKRSRLHRRADQYMVDLDYRSSGSKGTWITTSDNVVTSHEEKTTTTISSLMTVLCAVGLLRSVEHPADLGSVEEPHHNALQDIAVDAQQVIELGSIRLFSIQDEAIAVPLLAAALVQATFCRGRQAFADSLPALFDRLMSISRHKSVIEVGGSFVCAVADCCARATSESVFDHVQKMVQHIRNIAESLRSISGSHEVCSRIGVAAGLEYADSTKHPKHLHWALEVEQAVTGSHLESIRRTPAKTPSRDQTQGRSGYRWEAGICEWVARTPALSLPRPQAQREQEISTQAVEGGTNPSGNESTVVLSSGRNLAARKQHRLRKHNPSIRKNTLEALTPDRVGESRTGGRFFSHIYIEDDEDELSTSESSQEAQARNIYRLRQITNIASSLNRNRAVIEQRSERCKRRRSDCKELTREQVQHIEVGRQDQAVTMNSEDELSFM
ncbi:MAG: hypothetical protein Q9219_001272 [cf. Caloplaca sp. 3 TL-2023]